MNIQIPAQAYDLVVVGGGMVGASFASALSHAAAGRKLSLLVVEAFASDKAKPLLNFDARSTAMSYGSSQIFQRMGMWQQLESSVTAIKEIQISDQGKFGSTRFTNVEQNVDALGYVIENSALGSCLEANLQSSAAVDYFCPASIESITPTANGMSLQVDSDSGVHKIEAGLVVLADGGKSPICSQLGIQHRVEQYQQHALIANIAFEKPHGNIAFERFTESGPLAVLPLGPIEDVNRGSLVWTLSEQQANAYRHMAESELCPLLQQQFGDRLGKIKHIGARFVYPLALSVAQEQIRPGLVLLGNVAHTLHPVAGQGFNLALRDAARLAQTLLDALDKPSTDGEALTAASPGSMVILQKYLQLQQADQEMAIGFTDYATRLFSSNNSAKVWLRKFGLLGIDLVPSLRKEFAKQAMGLGSAP